MDIRQDIFLRHMEQAAIEQIASEYLEKGYEVVIAPKDRDIGADLVVKKDKEIIAFEIKVGEWTDEKRRAVRQLRNRAVHELGANFKLVLVNLPKEPDIEIDDLENLFFELLPEHFVSEFSELATHHWVDEISDIGIEALSVRKDEIEVKGSGIISLGLQYGSDSDYERGDGIRTYESFYFNFHLLLDKDLKVKEILSLELEKPEE